MIYHQLSGSLSTVHSFALIMWDQYERMHIAWFLGSHDGVQSFVDKKIIDGLGIFFYSTLILLIRCQEGHLACQTSNYIPSLSFGGPNPM